MLPEQGAIMDHAPSQTPPRLLLTGLLFLIVAAIAWFSLNQSKAAFTNFVMPGDPGPFFLADFSIAVIGLAGLALVVRSRAAGRRIRTAGHAGSGTGPCVLRWGLAAAFVLTLATLPSAMTMLGTPVAVAVFALAWILVLQVRSRVPFLPGLLTAALSAAAAGVFVQLVFMRLLATPLPA